MRTPAAAWAGSKKKRGMRALDLPVHLVVLIDETTPLMTPRPKCLRAHHSKRISRRRSAAQHVGSGRGVMVTRWVRTVWSYTRPVMHVEEVRGETEGRVGLAFV